MKWINKKRGSGKTTGLIFTSQATQYPIIVETDRQAAIIKKQADKLGINIPEPMSVKQYFNQKRGSNIEKILIDESPRIIEKALQRYFEAEIAAVTMSLDDTKQ